MPKLEELLIAYERYCAELAEGELAKLIAKSKDKESTSIQYTGFFQKHLARCGELAKSEYIGAAFIPNPATKPGTSQKKPKSGVQNCCKQKPR